MLFGDASESFFGCVSFSSLLDLLVFMLGIDWGLRPPIGHKGGKSAMTEFFLVRPDASPPITEPNKGRHLGSRG